MNDDASDEYVRCLSISEVFVNLWGVCQYVRCLSISEVFVNLWGVCQSERKGQSFSCIYRFPNSDYGNNEMLYYTVRQTTNLAFSHILIFGNFNYPSINCINWNDVTSQPEGNQQSAVFLEAARVSFLCHHVTESKHYQRTMHAKHPGPYLHKRRRNCRIVENLKYLAPVGKSHHTFLKFNFCCYTKSHRNRTNKFKWDKGDYDTMRGVLIEKKLGRWISA